MMQPDIQFDLMHPDREGEEEVTARKPSGTGRRTRQDRMANVDGDDDVRIARIIAPVRACMYACTRLPEIEF